MSFSGYILENLGVPVLIQAGTAALTSDGLAATDNAAGITVGTTDDGIHESILFILAVRVAPTAGTATVQVQYSSTGSASDAVTSNAGMTCTDISWALDSDDAIGLQMIEVDVAAKGIGDAAGKFFVSATADSDFATGEISVIAIGKPTNTRLPHNTVTLAKSVA